jgi:hypothetical protein
MECLLRNEEQNIRDSFRAINQSYAMASVNKEVERGTINVSSFRPHISIMGRTYYRVRTLQPRTGQEDTGRYLPGYYVHNSEMRRTNLHNGVALSEWLQASKS